MDLTKKRLAWTGAGTAAVVTAVAGLVTAVHGSHSTSTAISQNKTPVVVNRPRDASGSPLPVSVEKLPDGTPLVIVGHGAPGCETPTPTPSPTPTPTPSPTDSPDC